MVNRVPDDLSFIRETANWLHAQFATARKWAHQRGWTCGVGYILRARRRARHDHAVCSRSSAKAITTPFQRQEKQAPGDSTRTLEPRRLRQSIGRVQSPGVDGAELEHGAILRGPCLEVGPGGMAALPDPDTAAQSDRTHPLPSPDHIALYGPDPGPAV